MEKDVEMVGEGASLEIQIDAYLKELESKSRMKKNHLTHHKVNPYYRAKMVDWMIEVLNSFKCADQTFFLAVSIMDRYFNEMNTAKTGIALHDLHAIGVVSMFIASKYEDIYPLLMKTIHHKIAHQKISVDKIKTWEVEILQALHFKVGASSSPMDFIENYLEQIMPAQHQDKQFIHVMSLYLAKMALHHTKFCTLRSSVISTIAIYVAFKICEQMRKKEIMTLQMFADLIRVSHAEETYVVECSKTLLYLAQHFEDELPGLSNLRS